MRITRRHSKALIVACLAFCVAVAHAASVIVSFTPPVKYEDGSPLDQNSIDHYAVCVSKTGLQCDYIYPVNASTREINDYPDWAYQLKLRTVLKNGVYSDWSNAVTVGSLPALEGVKPDPPILEIRG